ncbi:uncharacterized protein KQ657_002465 [Scheffersomyces spartinae]|uniref:Cullin family profile domain-containing protein n=1 Tax=Scheffersomyces spartinae TaxID=45513 RepID=A0A9P8AHG0_9ASCO|nr:uncharacterized protein KQ657_002465 [Scheffersomyces spartinae]KAG7192103.1 hypothetical protein KQ657_002465 [Scheffersomyces spartinae]
MTEVSHLSLLHPQSDLRRNSREVTPGSENEVDLGNSSKRFKPNFDLVAEKSTWDQLMIIIDKVLDEGNIYGDGYESVNRKVACLLSCKSSYQSKLSNVILQRVDDGCEKMSHEIELLYLEGKAKDEDSKATFMSFMSLYTNWVSKLMTLSNIFIGLNSYLHRHPVKKTIMNHGVNVFLVSYCVKDSHRILPIALQALTVLRNELVEAAAAAETPGGATPLRKALVTFFQMCCVNDYFYKLSLGTAITDSMLNDYSEGTPLYQQMMKLYPQEFLSTVHAICYWESSFFKACKFESNFIKRAIVKLEWQLVLEDFGQVIPDIIEFVFLNEQNNDLFFSLCNEAQVQYAINYYPVVRKAIESLVTTKVGEFLDSANKKDSYGVISGLYQFSDMKQWRIPAVDGAERAFSTSFSKLISLKKYNSIIINLLCRYIDTQLRSSSSQQSSLETSFKDKFMFIISGMFHLIEFCESYKRDLSRRLLQRRSLNIKDEKKVFEVLESHLGKDEEIIQSISSMFKDIEEEQVCKDAIDFGFDFKPLVLESTQWPTVPKQSLILPSDLEEILKRYEKEVFLLSSSKNKSKKLEWSAYSVHQLTISTQFACGKKDLIVNMLQAVVLFAYREQDVLTLEELKTRTGMGDSLLQSIVSSFEKYKILIFEQESIHFNYNLKEKKTTIRIPLAKNPPLTATNNINNMPMIRRDMAVDRNDEFRAKIVRHMKGAQTVKYEDLLHKVVESAETKGQFRLTDIKKCIEDLIDDGYLERIDSESLKYIP